MQVVWDTVSAMFVSILGQTLTALCLFSCVRLDININSVRFVFFTVALDAEGKIECGVYFIPAKSDLL